MASCKDCVHVEVCCEKNLHVAVGMNIIPRFKYKRIEQECKNFKDRYMTKLDCEQYGFLDAEDYLNGACFECDSGVCSSGVLYALAVQAAEVRDRLKMYEDLAEQALKERGVGETEASRSFEKERENDAE